jgi:uncharacterized protein
LRRSSVLRSAVLLLAVGLLHACAQPADKNPSKAEAPNTVPTAPQEPAAPVGPQIPADAPPEPAPGPREPLQITTSRGAVNLQVEFADTENERARGLMYRRSMAPDHGMLFDFQEERDVFFWMKNTYIPLDMIFIRADGTIAAVASNTTPLSEAPVGPGTRVQAVLELNAGRAEALGIHAGDKVIHRIFRQP